MTRTPALVLDARSVEKLLDLDACIEAVERAFALHAAGGSLGSSVTGLTAPEGSFHVKIAGLALDGRRYVAAKTNANFPGNPRRSGLPTIQGVVALFDADDGQLLALMDSIVITSVRTGAASAVAARYLARSDSRVATVFGAGEQGEIQIRSLARVLPLERVHLVDVDGNRAAQLAERLSRDLGADVSAAADADAALAQSDVCVTCTPATRALLFKEQVRPGTFVAAVGADNPSKQELDPQLLAASTVVVDVLDSCATYGDLHHALAAGVMTREQVHAELADVVSGRRPGRTSDDEIVVFDSTGTALEDVAAAVVTYKRAMAHGDGLQVDLGARR